MRLDLCKEFVYAIPCEYTLRNGKTAKSLTRATLLSSARSCRNRQLETCFISSYIDCRNIVVEVFAHIGDIALELSGETGGSQELPAFSEGQWMLTVIPEVRGRAEELRQV